MKQAIPFAAAFVFAISTAASAQPARVELKNGDVISGTIVKMEGGHLLLQPEYSKKAIDIDWADVGAIESDAPARLELTSGDAITAKFVRREDGVYVESDQFAGVRPLPLGEVASIGLPAGPVWSGALGLSLWGTSGNTRTTAVGVKAALERESKVDRLRFDARTDNQTRSGTTEVQSTIGRASYEYFLDEWWFLRGFLDLEHDRFKDLDLRTTAGGGPGYRFIKTAAMSLTGYVGAAYVNENFKTTPDRNYVSAVAGEEFGWTISETQSIRQLLEVLPNVEQGKDWVAHFEAAYRQAVLGGIFMEASFLADYDNEPAPGKKKDDLKYGLTLGYQF